MKIINFFLPLFFSIPFELYSQLPGACGGGSSPAIACDQACINCNFNGFSGSTAGFPSGVAPQFCGTVENAQWLGFIAGEAHADFIITPSNCLDGNGVQVALYEDCTGAPLACDKGEMNGGNLPVSISVPLTPGANYYLLIDGYAGDQCDFTVTVTPNSAVYEPPLGDIQQVTGITAMCPGATFSFSVPPVFGAGGYRWSGPAGTLFDSIPSPAVLAGAGKRTVLVTIGQVSGEVCVEAVNSCSATPSSCIHVDVLPDAARPVLTADTVQFLNCTHEPLRLELEVAPPGNYLFAWTADSLGHIVNGAATHVPAVDKTGTYTTLVTNPLNGCASELSVRVGPPDVPTQAAVAVQHITCYGAQNGHVVIGEITGGKAPFLYSLDSGSYSAVPEFHYLEPYDHVLQVEGANGCVWDTAFTIGQPDYLILDLGADIAIELGEEYRLFEVAQISDPTRVDRLEVDPASFTAYLCDTCHFTPLHSFRYRLTVSDSNNCMASDERIVTVGKNRHVFIPNVFTPDKTDDNATFQVFGGPDVAEVRLFQVRNRWGQTVFETRNTQPNDPAAGWDGRLGGQKLTPDVYWYIAEVQFIDGNVERFQGDVTLVR